MMDASVTVTVSPHTIGHGISLTGKSANPDASVSSHPNLFLVL